MSANVIAILRPSEEHKEAAHRAFNGLAAEVQVKESGCLAFRVFTHEDGSMIIYKSYKSLDAWKTHRSMPWTQKALAEGKTEPIIHIYDSANTTGFGPRARDISAADSINIVAIINPLEKNKAEARQAFNDLATVVQAKEPGCIAFRVFHHDNGSMIIYKRYNHYYATIATPTDQVHRSMPWTQKALVDSKTEPVINVYSSSMTTGFGPNCEHITLQAGAAMSEIGVVGTGEPTVEIAA
ncbi:hypothetical protein K431DRAFT_299076 [Polychaeton citri CBS 116435]|uniref:ABM domain-containing protein n=1 Tax=Polychaeton citri CBS 116435 TaxID=1314669 RepID=A0A9P4Q0P8_9PEZI|nr:hypothetical protein K431DRAFT_299076 [Polychaeton citri CBS 116435]